MKGKTDCLAVPSPLLLQGCHDSEIVDTVDGLQIVGSRAVVWRCVAAEIVVFVIVVWRQTSKHIIVVVDFWRQTLTWMHV